MPSLYTAFQLYGHSLGKIFISVFPSLFLFCFFVFFSVCICVPHYFHAVIHLTNYGRKTTLALLFSLYYYDCSNAFLLHYCIPFNRRSRILSSFYVLFYFPFTGKSFWRHSLQFRVKSVKLKKRKKREN